jgi:hypothetical protein
VIVRVKKQQIDLKASPTAMLDDDFLKDVWNRQRRTALIPIKVQIAIRYMGQILPNEFL